MSLTEEVKPDITKIREFSLVGYNNEVHQVSFRGIQKIDVGDKGIRDYISITNGKKSKLVLLSDVKPIIITLEWLLFVGFRKKNNILEYILPEEIFNILFSKKYIYKSFVAKINKNNKVKLYHQFKEKGVAIYLHEMQNLNHYGFSKLSFYYTKYYV